ncbi:MAG TPA: hypothetical protein VH442_08920 [Micromonosporaceae bacterium]|jgi:hypothetical protein
MLRTVIVAAAAVVVVALGGCTTDVIPTGHNAPALATSQFAAPAPTLCGPDASTRASVFMLTQKDLWPDSSTTRQAYANYTLDPTACQTVLAATPNPEPVDCGEGFPYYPENQQISELARIGVVAFHAAQLQDVASDGTVSSMVSEFVLNLAPGAGTQLVSLARRCGAQSSLGLLTSTVQGRIEMVLQVGILSSASRLPDASIAVALTFDAHAPFTNEERLDLLNKAEALASN